MAIEKTVSVDRTNISYTKENKGFRAWKDHVQAIRREGEHSDWANRGGPHNIPIDFKFRSFPEGVRLQPADSIASSIEEFGSDELKRLVAGNLLFEVALDS